MGVVFTEAFAMDKLKMMTGAMAACTGDVIRAWEVCATAATSGEVMVEMGQQFTELTTDVTSHTAFDSSYGQGKEVFLAQRELQFIAFASINNVRVPGTQYMLTKANVMQRIETRRGWREVGPYPLGLNASTARVVCIGGGEKVVVTGALDGCGGGGYHALWVFDVMTKNWTVEKPPRSSSASCSPSPSSAFDLNLAPVPIPDQESTTRTLCYQRSRGNLQGLRSMEHGCNKKVSSSVASGSVEKR